MRIGKPNAFGIKGLGLDQKSHFADAGDWDLNKRVQLGKGALAVSQGTQSHFGCNEWVHCDAPDLEQAV